MKIYKWLLALLLSTFLQANNSIFWVNHSDINNNSFFIPLNPIDNIRGCIGKYVQHIVYFADEHDPHNRLLIFDYKNMLFLDEYHVEGSLNHHADLMGIGEKANYIMMVAKGSNFVSFYTTKDGEFIRKMRLPFRPRSADAYNPIYKMVLLTSRDRPAGVLIDVRKLKMVGKAGFNITCKQEGPINDIKELYQKDEIPNLKCNVIDFGGDQVCGHPIWISSRSFAILDRANRKIHIFKMKRVKRDLFKTKLIQTISTDTSLHQMIPKNSKRFLNRYFFGESEGNVKQNRVVHLYKFKRVGLKLKKVADLPLVLGNIRGFAGHNLFITPDLKYLYAPVGAIITQDNKLQKGGVFVVDAKSMKIISFIPAGFGAGHVAFSPQKGYAIITNHKDEFLTIADYRTHKFITNIYPNFPHQNIASLNFSHSQYVDESGEYYYNFWSDGGVFFRLNLNTLEIDDFINVGGVPIQGNFVKEVSTACRIPQIAPTDGFEELFGSWFNKDKVDPKDSSKVINGYDDKKEFRKRLLKEIQRIKTILKKNKNLSKYTQEYLKRLLRVYWRMIKGV